MNRLLAILDRYYKNRADVYRWLKNPHPELGYRTPISLVVDGYADGVSDMLESADHGIPT